MSESLVVFAIAVVGAGLVTLGAFAWHRLRAYRLGSRHDRPDEEWSPGRYQPLERLLAREDLDFLRQNTECPKVAARWERSRRKIVRLYVKELAVDFQRLHRRARVMVAESPEQYAPLLPVLLKQQILFWRTLVTIELRLSFGGLHVTPASVRSLIEAIEAMQQELSRVGAVA